jgi:predicted DNA-binding transcriptional regulator YafY
MAAAVVTEGEMTVNQLADKFAVSRDVVLHVFHSLVMARETANENVFFLPFELGDLEDDDDDNFLYIALPESESMFGGPDPLSWTEVFSVQLMLEQISRLAHGSPVAEHASSLAAKIHDATDISMKVIVRDSPFGQLITDALETSILRIQYQSAGRADASWREIVPVEVQIVRGIGYIRAVDPSGEGGYRTYAMDRVWDAKVVAPFTGTLPVDQHSDWLASMLSQGHAVLIEVDEGGLPVFEGLPNVEVADDATDFGFVLKVIVADQAFLDERLAVAGPHARVIGETTTRSGVEFAKKLARTLK